jgi:hypothetical protein
MHGPPKFVAGSPHFWTENGELLPEAVISANCEFSAKFGRENDCRVDAENGLASVRFCFDLISGCRTDHDSINRQKIMLRGGLPALTHCFLTECLAHHAFGCCSDNQSAKLFCDSDGLGCFPIFNEGLNDVVIPFDCDVGYFVELAP